MCKQKTREEEIIRLCDEMKNSIANNGNGRISEDKKRYFEHHCYAILQEMKKEYHHDLIQDLAKDMQSGVV